MDFGHPLGLVVVMIARGSLHMDLSVDAAARHHLGAVVRRVVRQRLAQLEDLHRW